MSKHGMVCYCPELRLYHYKIIDDDKPKHENTEAAYFDEEALEDAIAQLMALDKTPNAEALAQMTGLGRLHPHKVIEFTDDDNPLIIEASEYWKRKGF